MAYIMTEDWVKQRLKSPGSAVFPKASEGRARHATYLGNQRYSIRSWVDSQNSFGGLVRTTFTAEMRQVDEYNWELVSLALE